MSASSPPCLTCRAMNLYPPALAAEAYTDRPLPIGHEQTISQPFMVAAMAAALELSGGERVLEIGTGSGYQAAVLSLLAREVHTVEMHEDLALAPPSGCAGWGMAMCTCILATGLWDGPMRLLSRPLWSPRQRPDIPPPLDSATRRRRASCYSRRNSRRAAALACREARLMRSTSRELYHCRFVPLIGQYGWKPKDT